MGLRRASLEQMLASRILGVLLLLSTGRWGQGQELYDAARSTLPSAQGWNYLAVPGTAIQSLAGGAARLDTTALSAEMAGYFRIAPVPLDRAVGFAVLFTIQIHSESHATTDRAGFSVIVLGQDKKGIELGFWTDGIFAQSDSPLFTHAEDAATDLATAPVDCVLVIGPTNYVLHAQNTPILSGPVRDYTAFVGPYDPYETPDFLFLGDDSTSSMGAASVKRVVLFTPPHLTVQSSAAFCWTGVSNQTYSVQRSLDLSNWVPAGSVYSPTSRFCYTNAGPTDNGFFRVVWP